MIALLSFISPIIFSALLIHRLLPSLHLTEKLGLGYLFGYGGLTLLLFGFGTINLSLSGGLATVLTIFFLITSLILYLTSPKTKVKKTPKWQPQEKLLLGAILLLGLAALLYSFWGVVSTWDALTLYDFRARRIVESGGFSLAANLQGSYFFGYPLHTSLSHVWLYLTGWTSPLIFYVSTYLSLLLVVYGRLRSEQGRMATLLGVFMLALAPHYFWHSQIAYTNLPYSTFIGLGTIYCYAYARSGKLSYLLISSLLTGLSTWVRSVEPFWLVNLGTLVLAIVFNRQYLSLIIPLTIILPIERVWKLYKAIAQSSLAESSLAQIVSTTQTITQTAQSEAGLSILTMSAQYFFTHALRPYAPVIILFLLTLLIKSVSRSREWWLEFQVASYYLLAYLGTFVFATSQSYWQQIPGSLERMMMFVSLPIIYGFIRGYKKV